MDKATWAAGKARELRDIAATLRRASSQGSYIKAARKGEAIRRLEAHAWRLERMARGRAPVDLEGLPF